MIRNLTGRINLLTKFSLAAFLITAAISITLVLGIQREFEQNTLRQAAESAVDQVATIIRPNLSDTDLKGPLDPARYELIDTLVKQYVLREHIVRVKIWNLDGILLYTDEKEMAGRQFEPSHEMEEVMKGETVTEISSLEKEENISERQRYERLMEVYTPLESDDSAEVVGAYEIYYNLQVLEPGLASMRRFVALSMAVGFLVLYGSLFTLVRNASRELVRRSEENKRLFNAELTRRTELDALYDLSRALAEAAPDRRENLDMIVHKAVETTHVTFASIYLLENERLVRQAIYPVRLIGQDILTSKNFLLENRPFLRKVMEQNMAVVLGNEDFGQLAAHEESSFKLDEVKTHCIVPLRAGDRALGILVLGEARSEEREPFSAEKVSLARGIGDQTVSALYRAELFEQLERSYLETVLALATAVDAKDTYTADHAESLANMASAIGRDLGMSEGELDDLRFGAILHDVGKIGVLDTILQKPGKLNKEEWAQMREHSAIGSQILAPIPRLSGAARMVRHHHERYDGKGYPDGVKGEDIPIGARIITVADSYSAMVDKRVYKAARSHEEATAELEKCAGSQFDPKVVRTFLRLAERGIITTGRSFQAA